MSYWAKSGLTWAAVLCLVAAGFAVHYAMIQGLFSPTDIVTPGVCRTIATGVNGAEDFAIDPLRNVIFVAAQDGIYRLKLDDVTAAPVKLAGPPKKFHPGGISLYRMPDGSETLMAIDHGLVGRSGVETYAVSFDGDAVKLSQQTAVQSRNLVSPNAISAIAPDKFYVTNDHVTTGALGRFAEDYLLWPHADVMLSNGMGLRIAVQRIAYPSGILARGGFLYVAAANERRLLAMGIEDFTGNLTEIGALSLPARLGNISMDTAGDLIVAGQTKPGSAQVFKVKLGPNGVPLSYETIFSDDGHLLKGASAAAIWNGRLFISSAHDSKMLACDIK